MKWYRDLKISVKLIIGFLIVAMMTGITGIMGMFNLDNISDNAEYLYSYATEPIRQVSSALNLYHENRVEVRNLLLLESDSEIKERIAEIRENRENRSNIG